MLQHVLEHLVLGVGDAHAVGDLFDEAGLGVHRTNELAHGLECARIGLDDDAEPRVDGGQVVVGDDDRDLDELVDLEVEPGHFTVDPDQSVTRGSHAASLAGGADMSRRPERARMVPPERFELPTKWVETTCSVH